LVTDTGTQAAGRTHRLP